MSIVIYTTTNIIFILYNNIAHTLLSTFDIYGEHIAPRAFRTQLAHIAPRALSEHAFQTVTNTCR